MKIILQRVSKAQVRVDQQKVGEISKGLLLLVGIGQESSEAKFPAMVQKIINLRIFEDEQNKMNRSLLDIQGEILVISQFTLYASIKKGRRPDFFNAASGEKAKSLFQLFTEELKKTNIKVEQGIFGSHMEVDFVNDGPVTIIISEDDIT